VARAGNIQDLMAISNFLNPADEAEVEKDNELDQEEILQEVLSEHLGLQQAQDDDDDNDEQPERPVYSLQDARNALKVF
jgi:hypothetical protein